MPELPEVETIRRGLEKYVVGHAIQSVEILRPKMFEGDSKDIEGATITSVERFGKGLVINLSNRYSLAIHVKLTGQLIYKRPAFTEYSEKSTETQRKIEEGEVSAAMMASGFDKKEGRIEVPNKATQVIFKFKSQSVQQVQDKNVKVKGEEGAALYYNDIRQFGWIKVVPTDKVHELPFFKELGPEFPLIKSSARFAARLASPGQKFLTFEKFSDILSRSKLAIKQILMDQKKMSGIGNIYANDGLYLAKIDPKRQANTLTAPEAQNLYNALLTVLQKGLEEGGASELTFVNILGEPGNYQNHTLVYGHNGEKCKRDGTVIQKTMLGGRGTYFCPTCQI